MATERLRLVPLGGLGEIGINCLVLEWKGQIVLLDCGIQFPDASYPGVELFIPDLSYVRERMSNLKGIVVTHGHDDHIGAISYLAREAQLDVYCTPFPKGLISQRLSESNGRQPVRFHKIQPGTPFEVGPFKFHPVGVHHSIIEALAFGIETPVGLLVHSGDYKHDSEPFNGQVFDLEPFKKWGEQGVHLLMVDSTNAQKTGHTVSEHDISDSFEEILSKQKSRIFIALFASNVRRIGNLLALAKKLDKKVALVGRSMHSYTKLAHDQNSMDIPVGTLILPEDIQSYPDEKVVVFVTGSQAEPQSALLRMAHDRHKEIRVKEGDHVILSSRFIPGNEKAISSMINQLYRQGAQVTYEAIHQIHVSGHGYQEELQMLHTACRPQVFIPVHGEYHQMAKHARLARDSGIPEENIFVIENGQIVETDGVKLTMGEKLQLKKTPIVQGALMEQRPTVFAQRNGVAKAGIVFSFLVRESKTAELVGRPTIATHGVLYKQGEDAKEVHERAVKVIESLYCDHAKDENLPEQIRVGLRRFYKSCACYKPIVYSQVFDV